jgi:predicted dehydrogenase
MRIKRRDFLVGSIGAGVALAATASSYGRILGTNGKPRLAVIGLNGRGTDHIAGLKDNVVALCDCDEAVLEKRVAGFESPGIAKFTDFRKLLESSEIDCVSIATPNHTHSLIAVHAMLAGKDVYVEKPVSHNVWEGRQLVAAAAKLNRVCQCGTQSRSSSSLKEAVEFVRSGSLGGIQYAIGTCFKPRMSIGKSSEPLKIPATIDYDLWCGPAQKRELFRPNLHYDWHWDFNTGNGDMGNQGIHQMDIARWFLGENQVSPRVISIGARLGYDDAGNTPNTQIVLHDYPIAPLIFETRGLPKNKAFQESARTWAQNMNSYRGCGIGVVVQCDHGHVLIPNYSSAIAYDDQGAKLKEWNGDGNHYTNFLDSVLARDSSKLNAPILEGHLSSALCHTGGISHQAGQLATVAEIKQAIGKDLLFLESFERMVQHLSDNAVDLNGEPKLTLGAELRMDGVSETITNNPTASHQLTREYRRQFEFPTI